MAAMWYTSRQGPKMDGGWLGGRDERPCEASGRCLPRRFPRTAVLPLLLLLHCYLLLPARSLALDGVVDGRSTVQNGLAGTEEYRQTSTQTEVGANQLLPLAGGFRMRFDGRVHRELFHSRFGSIRSSLDRRTSQAGAALDHNGRLGSFTLDALAFDQKTLGAGVEVPRLERRQVGTSAEYGRSRIRLNASGLFIASRREVESADPVRDEEWLGTFGSRAGVPRLGELGYRFSTLTDRNLNRHSSSNQTTHTVTFSSATRFAGGRGLAALKTSSGFFTQTQTRQVGAPGARLLVPHAGGFLLDDTPELHDPLEPELTPAGDLYDGDRQAATAVQIGDAAPAVREFGGDYRNIVFDFGEATDLVSAILYIDHTLLAPELFRWRVFVSNDPEGRRWDEASGAGVVYQEWGVGLKGWAVTFTDPASARFLKMVDVKLGPTIPDLSVTELEVFTQADEVKERDRSHTTNHRANLSLGYQFSSSVRAGYDVTYRRRTLTGQPDALQDVGHGFTGAWTRGTWALSGRYELRTLEGRESQKTKANTQNVALKRGRNEALETQLSWTRIRDESPGVEKTSNSISLGSIFRAAPSLRLSQRVTGSKLTDEAADRTSNSVVLVTSVVGEPVPSMSLDLEQSERWVSQEAGTGFSRFDDTSLTLGWRPVPLISLSSMIRYQVRDGGDWFTRNSISWEPLSEGSVKVGFSAHHFRDTRASETQRGGGAQLEWAARPSLTLQGSVQAVVLKTAQQKNSPLNTEIRGIWRF